MTARRRALASRRPAVVVVRQGNTVKQPVRAKSLRVRAEEGGLASSREHFLRRWRRIVCTTCFVQTHGRTLALARETVSETSRKRLCNLQARRSSFAVPAWGPRSLLHDCIHRAVLLRCCR